MNTMTYKPLTMLVLTLSLLICANQARATNEPAQSSASGLLTSLPASDVVLFIDAKRVMNDALPAVFGTTPALLADINKQLNEFKTRSGINPRDIEQIAIGAKLSGAKEQSLNVLVIARGDNLDAAVTVAAGLKESARGNASKAVTTKQDFQSHTIYSLDGDLINGMAVAAMDTHTLMLGSAESIRAALSVGQAGYERVSDDLIQLATHDTGAMIGFAGRFPKLISAGTSSETGPFIQTLSGIKEFSGSFTIAENEARMNLRVRTVQAEQARQIGEQLHALKELAAASTNKGRAQHGEIKGDEQHGLPSSNKPKGNLRSGSNTSGQTIALPGLGLLVAAPSMDVLKDLSINVEGAEVIIKLNHPLSLAVSQ